MNTQFFFKAAAALLLAGALFTACEKDGAKDTPEEEIVTAFDDLAYFQDAFVEMDANGEFVGYCVGEPIYENDPTHLYIGVDTMEEALEYWDACLAPDIKRTTSVVNNYSYQLTGADGTSQGTVSFAPGTGASIAEITTNASGLKHFTKVTFLLNSAWPFNSEAGSYYLGDVRKIKLDMETNGWLGYKNREVGFVCVREKANGVKPMYVAISDKTYHPENIRDLLGSKYVPGVSKAKDIYKLLHTDWDLYVAAFEEAGEGALDKDKGCWIDKYTWAWIGGEYQYTINLVSGSVSSNECLYHNPHRRVLLKIDWYDD